MIPVAVTSFKTVLAEWFRRSEGGMVGVIATFRFGTDFDAAWIRRAAKAAQVGLKGMPGLCSQLCTTDVANREAVNASVWESEAAASAYFTPDRVELLTGLYGVEPSVQIAPLVALVENAPSSQS